MRAATGVLRRCVRRRVDALDDAFAAIACVRAHTVVVDVEPLVARWGSDSATLSRGLARIEATVDSISSVSDLVFMTNSRRVREGTSRSGRLTVAYVMSARKPWTLRALRDLPSPLAIIGDQVLTDGLLAWRLRRSGAEFVHVRTVDPPWWPRLQAVVGAVVAPFLFRERECDA